MPGKARRKKKKYSLPNKQKQGMPSYPITPAGQTSVAQNYESLATPVIPVSSANLSIPKAKLVVIQHPYITSELRTIGILAGIMLVVLVVLALVLH